tara:strand:- start:172 stop:399 length:228 start_codon:yes stop_codon:yes gene_type:complete
MIKFMASILLINMTGVPQELLASSKEPNTKEQPRVTIISKESNQKQEAIQGENDDTFVPTEEISEDFAVSFPVDI